MGSDFQSFIVCVCNSKLMLHQLHSRFSRANTKLIYVALCACNVSKTTGISLSSSTTDGFLVLSHMGLWLKHFLKMLISG